MFPFRILERREGRSSPVRFLPVAGRLGPKLGPIPLEFDALDQSGAILRFNAFLDPLLPGPRAIGARRATLR
jgi:hypothetical protein